MLQFWIIALVAAVYLHDEFPHALGRNGAGAPIWLLFLPYVLIGAIVQGVCHAATDALDRNGSRRAVEVAERTLFFSRAAIVMTHAVAVFAGGWVEMLEHVTGVSRTLTLAAAVLPPLTTIGAGWWSFYPIDRRLRDAALLRTLESGGPAYPTPSRWQYVLGNVRHQALFILLPMAALSVWTDACNTVFRWVEWGVIGGRAGSATLHTARPAAVHEFGAWLRTSRLREAIKGVSHFAGVVGVLALAPLLMRMVWDAVPLAPGTLRDRLMALCARARVRVRDLLVWRTHGGIYNGAALGIIAPLRYILLTDALLDQLPQEQVEAVMGHEVGHARHHHIAWLLAALAGSVGGVGVVLSIGALLVESALMLMFTALRPTLPVDLIRTGIEQVAAIASLVVGFALFGAVSRRFEWQADAFAVRELSLAAGSATATPEAAGAMSHALASVARLNNVPQHARSFRHGSIALRRRRLERLVGQPLDRLSIDVQCRWVKAGAAFLAALTLAAALASSLAVQPLPRALPEYPSSRLEEAP